MIVSKIAFRLFAFLFLLFVASLLLTLGTDTPRVVSLRMFWGGILILLSLFTLKSKKIPKAAFPCIILFGLLIVFEIVRAVWVFVDFNPIRGETIQLGPMQMRYLQTPIYWLYYFIFFFLAFLFFQDKTMMVALQWVLMITAFFISLSLLPLVISQDFQQRPFYRLASGIPVPFPPFLYVHHWIREYILGFQAHLNWTGDVIAGGFFPVLSMIFFSLINKNRERKKKNHLEKVLILSLIGCVTALVVVLFQSRGTIIAFFLGVIIFFIALLSKFPSKKSFAMFFISIFLVSSFLMWGADLEKIWEEVASVEEELDDTRRSSFTYNLESMQRSWHMYLDHPLWGVGWGGYQIHSADYAGPDSERLYLSHFRALNHYLHLMAEEGLGSMIYILFLFCFWMTVIFLFAQMPQGFFAFVVMGLGAYCLMLLSHAMINHLLQNFVFSLLLYILMGALLGAACAECPLNRKLEVKGKI